MAIPIHGIIFWPCNFFSLILRTINEKLTKRNANERLKTENEINLDKPEKIERENAIIPWVIKPIYGVPYFGCIFEKIFGNKPSIAIA